MRLEPVHLVAPPPKPTTRRDFVRGLLCGAVAGGMLGVGGAQLWRMFPAEKSAQDEDPRLTWALALQQGPLDQLVRDNVDFLLVLTERHEARTLLEPGIARMTSAVLDDDPVVASQRAILAAKLAQVIERLDPSSSLLGALPELARLRK